MANDEAKKGQQQIGTASKADTAVAEPASKADPEKPGGSKKVSAKPATQRGSKHLISFTEYRASTDQDISDVLAHGFKVWMQTVTKEPLRARTISVWDRLIDEYLKS